MSVVLLSRSVTSMPTVRIITALMFVLVRLGLQEMEKHAVVRVRALAGVNVLCT